MNKLILREQEEITNFLEKIMLDNPDYIAIDIETDWFSEEKFSPLQLGLDGIGLYDGKNTGFIVHKEGLDYSGLNLLVHTFPLLTQNGKFDISILLKHGYITDLGELIIHDTKLLSFLHDENKISHSLKDLASTILGKSNVVRIADVGQKPIMERSLLTMTEESQEEFRLNTLEPWENTLGSYCIDDCVNTYELFHYFKENLATERLWDIYEKIELPFLKVLIEMEMNGIKVDTKYILDIGKKIEDKILDLQIQIFKEAGESFNIGSAKQVQEIFQKLKIIIPEKFKTAKGGISTSSGTLKYLNEQGYKIAGLILEWREFTKLETGFIDSLISKNINGKIHCQFNQIGTITGRLSCKDPNLMQIPRRDDEFDIRKAFKSSEGSSFIISDISQAELRILAHFSQEPVLLDAFNSGKDIHQATADKLGITRTEAKTINFGIIYGMGSYGLAESLGITRVKAGEIIKNYFSELPGVERFIKTCYNTVRSKGYINTIIGRHRNFPNYEKTIEYPNGATQEEKKAINLQYYKDKASMERQIVNSCVQGSASDYIKLAMRNIQRDIKQYGASILVSIHDEILVECPDDKLPEVKEIVANGMKNAIKLNGVPVEISLTISKYWVK